MSLHQYASSLHTALESKSQQLELTLESLFTDLDQELILIHTLESAKAQVEADASLVPALEDAISTYVHQEKIPVSEKHDGIGSKIKEVAHAVWERIKAILKAIRDFIMSIVEKIREKFNSLKHKVDKTKLAFRAAIAPRGWVAFTVDETTAEWVAPGVKTGAPLKARAVVRADALYDITRYLTKMASTYMSSGAASSDAAAINGWVVQLAGDWQGNTLARTLPQNVLLEVADHQAFEKTHDADHVNSQVLIKFNAAMSFHHVFEHRDAVIPKDFEMQLGVVAQEVLVIESIIDTAEDVLNKTVKDSQAIIKDLERIVDNQKAQSTYDGHYVHGLQALSSMTNKVLSATTLTQSILGNYCLHYLKFADAAIAASAHVAAK